MVGGGPFRLEPGQWTDDTSMALCLAESLISCGRFNPLDQMEHYRRWYREGYLNSTGTCFDIGNTVRGAIHIFERTGEPYAGPTDPRNAGNGSIMCLAPVPLFYARQPPKALEYARASSRTTHGTPAALGACEYLADLMVGAVYGQLAGALYDVGSLPAPWLEMVTQRALIEERAGGLFKGAENPCLE